MNTKLRVAAQHILNTLADEMTTAGMTVPERRYTHSGQIAHDFAGNQCVEALVVAWDGSFQGQIGAERVGNPQGAIACAMPMTAQFTVALLRCIPTLREGGTAPSVPDLQSSANQLLDEAWTLPDIIINSTLNGMLPDTNIAIDLLGIGDVSSVGPLGQVGGVTVTLFVSIL